MFLFTKAFAINEGALNGIVAELTLSPSLSVIYIKAT